MEKKPRQYTHSLLRRYMPQYCKLRARTSWGDRMFARPRQFLSMVLVLLLSGWPQAQAHDIPGRATVLAYVKPQDDQLLALIRVPMEAMTEVQFPVRGPGYIDLARADPALADAAKLYVLDGLQLFADGKLLSGGRIVRTRVALVGDRS